MAEYETQPKGIRVLVVDDDYGVRRIVCNHLAMAGYAVASVSSGEAGVEAVKAEPFSLVLLDIFMPDKDGLETLREMRKVSPDLKAVAMSGQQWYRGMDVLGWAQKLGAAGVIAKPFARKDLLDAVGAALEEQPTNS